MEKMPIFKENNNAGMAMRTFKDKMTIGSGADQIDLYYFGRGHTNGDAWVGITNVDQIINGRTPEALAAEWTLPEKYKGYSAQVSPMMGGLVGRIQALQKESRAVGPSVLVTAGDRVKRLVGGSR